MLIRILASTNLLPLLWALFFVAMFILGIATSQGLVIAFGIMGIAMGGISLFWDKLALEELHYEREISQRRVFVGDELSMSVVVSNRKPIPLTWMRVEDNLPESIRVVEGDSPSNIKTGLQTIRHSASIKWYEKLRWRYRLRCTERGLYRLGPALLQSGDPFGFRRREKPVSSGDSILVYPRIIRVENLGIEAGRPLGEIKGGIRIFQDPSRPAGLREYLKGDPLKIIDWKATARLRKLHVRTFEPSTSITVVLVVAVDTKEPYWESYAPEDLERVLIVATSVASHATELDYSIGLFTNDMPIPVNQPMIVPPGNGPDQLGRILEELATVREYAFGPMSEKLGENVRHFPIGSTIAIVTAFISPNFVNSIVELRRRGHKIVVLYVGKERCPDLEDGIVVHNLRDHLIELEESGVFGPT